MNTMLILRNVFRSSRVSALSMLMALAFVPVFFAHAEEPSYGSTVTIGGTDDMVGNGIQQSIRLDSAGNRYIFGAFQGTVDFDPLGAGDVKATSQAYALFLTKRGSDGSYQWTNVIEPSTECTLGGSHAVDGYGDVYIAGSFGCSVDFDPAGSEDIRTSNDGSDDFFLTKYDTSGTYEWTHVVGGTKGDGAKSIVIDQGNNVYITGFFDEGVDFDPDPVDVDAYGSVGDTQDSFVTKYDMFGDYVWTRTGGGAGDDSGRLVTVDGFGNVYSVGFYEGVVDFDEDPVDEDIHGTTGEFGGYMIKRDSGGEFLWTRTWENYPDFRPASIITSDSNKIHITGNFRNTQDFDPAVTQVERTSNGETDIFVMQFDTSGYFQWVRTFGGFGFDGGSWTGLSMLTGDEPLVTVDSAGNVYVAGSFEGTVDFNPGAGVNSYSSNGGSDVFVTKLTSSGGYLWTKSVGGTEYDKGASIAVDDDGNISVIGLFGETVDFDFGTGTDERTAGAGNIDFFLSEYSIPENGGGGTNLDGSIFSYNWSDILLDINATIALGCDSSVTMNAIVGTGRSVINDDNRADCTITTNNSSGYKIEWQASADDMVNGTSDTLSAYAPVDSYTPETWNIPNSTSAWGAKLAATSEGYNGGAGGGGYGYIGSGWGSDDSYANGLFLNVSSSPIQIMEKSSETDFNGELQSIMFAAEIGADKLQPTGTYTQEVTVTATTL